eukprot:scaffold2633_cov156-Amphora_coffeaeformis.AAC.3
MTSEPNCCHDTLLTIPLLGFHRRIPIHTYISLVSSGTITSKMRSAVIHVPETCASIGTKGYGIGRIVLIAIRSSFVIARQAGVNNVTPIERAVTGIFSGRVWMGDTTAAVSTNVMIVAQFRVHDDASAGLSIFVGFQRDCLYRNLCMCWVMKMKKNDRQRMFDESECQREGECKGL